MVGFWSLSTPFISTGVGVYFNTKRVPPFTNIYPFAFPNYLGLALGKRGEIWEPNFGDGFLTRFTVWYPGYKGGFPFLIKKRGPRKRRGFSKPGFFLALERYRGPWIFSSLLVALQTWGTIYRVSGLNRCRGDPLLDVLLVSRTKSA